MHISFFSSFSSTPIYVSSSHIRTQTTSSQGEKRAWILGLRNCGYHWRTHYKKARLLQGKFAGEIFPRKFALDSQGNCDEKKFPRKTLANLRQNIFLAKLQPICETFPQTHAKPSQICDRICSRKSVTNLQGICV